MIYLLLIPVLYAYSSVAARHVQRLNLNLYSVGGLNYVFSALFYGALCLHTPQPLTPLVICGGIVLGVLYAVTYLFFVPTLDDRGVSVMAALCQVSALFPMLGALLIWHEHPSLLRMGGAILCLVAMPLLGLDQGISDTRLTLRKILVFGGLVVFNGGVLLGLKWFQALEMPEQFNGFMLTTFCSATAVMAVFWPAYKGNFNRGVVFWGGAISVSYAGAALVIVQALRRYEGAVVFPFAEATAVALTVAFAALVWREVPGRLGRTGIAIVTVATVLINC